MRLLIVAFIVLMGGTFLLLDRAGVLQYIVAAAIKRFAKRQMTWFRKDKRIVWLDMAGDPVAQASALIEEFLKK